MVKSRILILLCIETILLSDCASNAKEQILAVQSVETKSISISVQSVDIEQPTPLNAEFTTEPSRIGESNIDESKSYLDDTVYIGEYENDYVADLTIAKRDDGKYIVQIGIYHLTFLTDGIGELTADGMKFTATDASGHPICGIITVENQTAVVTFTDSTWEYLKNGSVYELPKSSDIPNIWTE